MSKLGQVKVPMKLINTLTQHIPTFVDIRTAPISFVFETTQRLLNLDYVKQFEQASNFDYFAISENMLLQVTDNGKRWWVVGYIKYPELVDLPKWIKPSIFP